MLDDGFANVSFEEVYFTKAIPRRQSVSNTGTIAVPFTLPLT